MDVGAAIVNDVSALTYEPGWPGSWRDGGRP